MLGHRIEGKHARPLLSFIDPGSALNAPTDTFILGCMSAAPLVRTVFRGCTGCAGGKDGNGMGRPASAGPAKLPCASVHIPDSESECRSLMARQAC
eukprot:1146967-Pelagomonas_calceolata.AAC.4